MARLGIKAWPCRAGELVGILWLSTTALAATTTGRIEGRATSSSGEALAGVSITATSASLPGARTTTCDARGEFHLLALPPGDYRVVAASDGFRSHERSDVRVPLNGAVDLTFVLSPAFSDEIEVTNGAPTIDATSAGSGLGLTRETFDELPLVRTSYLAVAMAAPGVVPSRDPLLSGLSIAGGTAGENRYLIDGLDTTNMVNGSSGAELPLEFLAEVQVLTGGLEADLGGALSGVVNVVTRSGGNTLHGDLLAAYRDQTLQAGRFGEDEGFRQAEVGASLGGAILPDRIWYFIALNGIESEQEALNLERHAVRTDTDQARYAGKLTWQAHPQHRLALSWFGDDRRSLVPDPNSVGRFASDWNIGSRNLALAWDGALGAQNLLEARLGSHRPIDERQPVRDVPYYVDDSGTGRWALLAGCAEDAASLTGRFGIQFASGCDGGGGRVRFDDGSRDQLQLAWSRFAGRAEWKAGGALHRSRGTGRRRESGLPEGPLVDSRGVVVDPAGGPGGVFHLRSGSWFLDAFQTDGFGRSEELAFFADYRFRWTPALSLILGLRAGEAEYGTEPRRGNTQYRSIEFEFEERVAPRAGVVWDVLGDGRSRLFASYGRYFESYPGGFAGIALGGGQISRRFFSYPADGSLPTYSNLGTFLARADNVAEATPRIANLKPTYSEELSAGMEIEPRPGWSVGARAVRRSLHQLVESFTVDGQLMIGNPGGTILNHPLTGESLAQPVTYPEPRRIYEALELTLTRRARGPWQLFASYVVSRLEGNYPGLTRPSNVTTDFDAPELLVNAQGRLPNDRPHQLKIFGSYAWPFRLTTGFFGQYLSGVPVSRLGRFPLSTAPRFISPRGEAGRTPDILSFDLRLAYPFRLRGDDLELEMLLDIFNVANRQQATEVDENWTYASRLESLSGECGGPGTGPGTACPEGNPQWGSPTAFQPARTLLLGAKLSW